VISQRRTTVSKLRDAGECDWQKVFFGKTELVYRYVDLSVESYDGNGALYMFGPVGSAIES